jgi:nucleosome binding factor SPN SPT16 subunit
VISLHVLDGYEFPDTLFCMTEKQVTFVSSDKKIKMLQLCKESRVKQEGGDVEVDLVTRGKQAEEWPALAQAVVAKLKASFRGKRAAVLVAGEQEQGFGRLVAEAVRDADMKESDAWPLIQEGVQRKDDKAAAFVRQAASKAAKLVDRWRKDLPEVDQDDASLTHGVFERKLEAQVPDEDKEEELVGPVLTLLLTLLLGATPR